MKCPEPGEAQPLVYVRPSTILVEKNIQSTQTTLTSSIAVLIVSYPLISGPTIICHTPVLGEAG